LELDLQKTSIIPLADNIKTFNQQKETKHENEETLKEKKIF